MTEDIDKEIEQLTGGPDDGQDGEASREEQRERVRQAMINERRKQMGRNPEKSATEYILEPELASDITKEEWEDIRNQMGPLLSRIAPLANLNDQELQWANEMIELVDGWFDVNPHIARRRLMHLLSYFQFTRAKDGFQTVMLSTQRQEMSQEVKDQKKSFLDKLFG